MSAQDDAKMTKRMTFLATELRHQTLVEYLWLGGSGMDIRGKTKVMDGIITDLKQLPEWNYDGSSTGQGKTMESEKILRPVKMIRDPFRGGQHLLALCESYNTDGKPAFTNFRHLASKVFEEVKDAETWFGIEQEYILYTVESCHVKYPIGWGRHGYNAPQGMYYCGVGAGFIYGRQVAEDHLRACLYSGLTIAGINAEVFPGQWEYQVGVCKGIDMCDQLWLSRYILQRVAENYGMFAEFKPKPVEGDWNGSGCHTNYSTKDTRDPKVGWDTFMKYLESMKKNHLKCIKLYGIGNEKRMTGLHETAHIDEFTYGVGARGCSVRIGNQAKKDGCGYMEDRRPSSNIDPYLSVSALADVTCNGAKNLDTMVECFEKARDIMEYKYCE